MMRSTRILWVAALLAAFIVAGASPGTAGVSISASVAGTVSVAPPTDCPAGYVITVMEQGAGVLTSEAYSGAVEYSSHHCTRLIRENPEPMVTVGRADFGELTFGTPGGDELYLGFQGPFVVKGAFPTDYRTVFNGRYSITGGTGVFSGASGSGFLGTLDQPSGITHDLHGSLVVPS